MILLAIFLFKFLFPELTSLKNDCLTKAETVTEWVCVKKSKGVHLYERWITVNDNLRVRERKGELISSCSLQEAEDYLRDFSTVAQWMNGIKTISPLTKDTSQVIYMVLKLPWPFANRDLIARYSYFKYNEHHSIVRVNSDNTISMPKNRCKRINDYQASWTIEHINDHQTRIIFKTFSSEPPLFPQWMQEPVLKKIFMGNLLRLKKRLSEV